MNIIGDFWHNFINKPLFDLLILLSQVLFNNLGLGIVALTILIRFILIPLTLPTLRYSKKMAELKPKLDELKTKHKDDRLKLAAEQQKLMKEHNLNPFAGCLPQLLQLVILYTLYVVFVSGLKAPGISTQLLLWNVSKPDPYYVLPALAGLTQFIYSKMLTPAIEHHPSEVKGEKKETVEDMAGMMQSQMLYMMPVMTTVIATALPAGLSLYWVVATIFQIIQQYFISGPGGLKKWLALIKR